MIFDLAVDDCKLGEESRRGIPSCRTIMSIFCELPDRRSVFGPTKNGARDARRRV